MCNDVVKKKKKKSGTKNLSHLYKSPDFFFFSNLFSNIVVVIKFPDPSSHSCGVIESYNESK